jgi:hypothetical protein
LPAGLLQLITPAQMPHAINNIPMIEKVIDSFQEVPSTEE